MRNIFFKRASMLCGQVKMTVTLPLNFIFIKTNPLNNNNFDISAKLFYAN